MSITERSDTVLPGAETVPLDIAPALNFPGEEVSGEFLVKLAEAVSRWPAGDQKPWGIPFRMAPEGAAARAIRLQGGGEARLALGCRADFVCVLHAFHKAGSDPVDYVEAQPVGEYELCYEDGSSHVQPVRARLDVPIPESPGPAQMAMPFDMPRAQDPMSVMLSEASAGSGVAWGRLQCGHTGGWGEPLVYAIRNPNPGKPIKELAIRGLVESPLLVAGVTAYRGTDHPLRHLARRMYRVRGPGEEPAKVESLEVDLGGVARVDHTIGPRSEAWLASPYVGVTGAAEPEHGGEDLFSIYGARDATVSVKLEGADEPVALSLGEAYEDGASVRGGVALQRLGGSKQWMTVEIIDGSTGRPTAARVHLSGAAGEYIAPYGHHEQINDHWFEDYGADVKVAGRSYAYVPGQFRTDLPTGDLYVEIYKGFEYMPTRCRVTVQPGQEKLTLRIDRWKDLRAQGWVTADTHVHFVSPHTAWLEAQCEGVNLVNLLASQWGRLFTNVGDITGRVGMSEDDTIVWVGTENRNHMLGHISMLGTKGMPVFPMCCGGVSEAWVGDPDFRTLAEWAMECREKEGVAVRPHFPYCGFTEDPVLAVLGVVDALEIRVGPGAQFPLQEWYRYLNNGYRVAVAGGTDKMGAYCALGSLRTYALLDRDEPFTFEQWGRAVRAGRTFATTGPLMDLSVEGQGIGGEVRLPAEGGRVEVAAAAESAWPLGTIEIVQDGRVVASESSSGGPKLTVSARVPVSKSGWIAARCVGLDGSPAGYMAAHTSPVYVSCGGQRPYDGPALEHMLNLTRGGIEYLETIATRFSDADQERMIRVYRQVEQHLAGRLHEGLHQAGHAHQH